MDNIKKYKVMDNIKKYKAYLNNITDERIKAAEIYSSASDSFKVSIIDSGEIDDYDVSETGGICMRVDSGNIGYAYSEFLEDEPQRLAQLALENAINVESQDVQFFYKPTQPNDDNQTTKEFEFDYLDKNFAEVTAVQKINIAKSLAKIAKQQDPRITKIKHCIVATSISSTRILNSLGLNKSSRNGYAIAYISVVAEQNGDIKDGSAFEVQTNVEKFDLTKIAIKATKEALGHLGAKQLQTGKNNVVIYNDAMCNLLQVFASMFSADMAQKNLSLLKEKLNQKIASSLVNLFDDPQNQNAKIKVPFDAEGVATQKTQIISNGVLKSFLHNLKTANKAGVQTTANASKSSVAAAIGVSPNHLVLQCGDHSFDELLVEAKCGVMITEVSGLHAGVNPVSGELSLLCKGFEIVEGKKANPVEQITIVCGFLELMQNIIAVGNDVDFQIGVASPSVLVKNIQIVGK